MTTRPSARSTVMRRPRATSSLVSSIATKSSSSDTTTNDTGNSSTQLAEQIHAWLTQELGYQPNATLINTSQATSEEEEDSLKPENLEEICRGALPPMLQHLRERLFARTYVAKIRQAIQCAYEKHQLPLDQYSTEHIRLAERRKEYNEALNEAAHRTEMQQQRCQEMVDKIDAKEKAVQILEEK
ncbi:hypothetical protein BDF22DRAFT_743927 [Syncephalis plumigaleata]|nr:hypothetical protein BDF22DRAFT_743927 [Syncephalis plumigaleata]